MLKYINHVLYIFSALCISMIYLNVPVYCSNVGECSWSKYLLLLLVPLSIIMTIFKIRNFTNLNIYLVFYYSMLCLFAMASYSIFGDIYSLTTLSGYTESFIIIILFSLFFRFSYLNNFNAHNIILISTLLAVIFNVVDLIKPAEFFQKIEGFNVRAAGYYINSNNAALAIVIGMVLTIKQIRPSYRIIYAFICLLGILTTFSRGGLLAWLILFGILLSKGIISRLKGTLLLLSLIFTVTLVPKLIDYLSNFNDEIYLLADRLDFFSGEASSSDFTDDARFELINNSIALFIENPVLGNGSKALLRYGYNQLSHNQFLAFLVDYGIFSFLIYLLFIGLLYIKLPSHREFMIVLIISSFFSHNIFDSYAFMIAFAYIVNYQKTEYRKKHNATVLF